MALFPPLTNPNPRITIYQMCLMSGPYIASMKICIPMYFLYFINNEELNLNQIASTYYLVSLFFIRKAIKTLE